MTREAQMTSKTHECSACWGSGIEPNAPADCTCHYPCPVCLGSGRVSARVSAEGHLPGVVPNLRNEN